MSSAAPCCWHQWHHTLAVHTHTHTQPHTHADAHAHAQTYSHWHTSQGQRVQVCDGGPMFVAAFNVLRLETHTHTHTTTKLLWLLPPCLSLSLSFSLSFFFSLILCTTSLYSSKISASMCLFPGWFVHRGHVCACACACVCVCVSCFSVVPLALVQVERVVGSPILYNRMGDPECLPAIVWSHNGSHTHTHTHTSTHTQCFLLSIIYIITHVSKGGGGDLGQTRLKIVFIVFIVFK